LFVWINNEINLKSCEKWVQIYEYATLKNWILGRLGESIKFSFFYNFSQFTLLNNTKHDFNLKMHKSFLNFDVIQHSLVIKDVCLLSLQRDGKNIEGILRVKDVIVRHVWHPSGVVPKRNSRFGSSPSHPIKEWKRYIPLSVIKIDWLQ
jgi:hypothetical protein